MASDAAKRSELAAFLKMTRRRLRAEDFGITNTKRRRTPGLRREEIAQAAGISTTWYVWLEQGRDVQPSPHTLRLLGKALRLSAPEQAYLVKLARPDLDMRAQQSGPMASDNLLALLRGLAPHPAYVVNRYWQVIAHNRAAAVLLGDLATDEWSRSLLGRLFLDPAWREKFADWPLVARTAVAQFRLATAAMGDDPVLSSLVASLQSTSEEFAVYWADRELADTPIFKKTIRHPVAGLLHFDFATLQPSGKDSDFLVSVYTPADAETRLHMARLVEPSIESTGLTRA